MAISSSLWTAFTTATALASLAASQQTDPQLVGTWTTKSRKVVTGPGFYDPVTERMFEPDLTGFSYSFTSDGHYEEAYYRAIANPTDPACPQGIMQWQHGSYVKNSNGSLSLTPIGVDGRQLLSDPCNYNNAIFTRYNQTELMKTYAVGKDAYSGAMRLDLFAFDGSPLNPMYLAYSPPQMLPTVTLNPTATATGGAAQATGTGGGSGSGKLKKRYHGGDDHLVDFEPHVMVKRDAKKDVLVRRHEKLNAVNADRWWWFGVGLTALGGIGYFCF